jgi:hypothetical protein
VSPSFGRIPATMVTGIESVFGGGVWAGVDVTDGEVLSNELVESASDLDLSRFAFCMDFGKVRG